MRTSLLPHSRLFALLVLWMVCVKVTPRKVEAQKFGGSPYPRGSLRKLSFSEGLLGSECWKTLFVFHTENHESPRKPRDESCEASFKQPPFGAPMAMSGAIPHKNRANEHYTPKLPADVIFGLSRLFLV